MRRWLAIVAVAALVGVSSPVCANICAMDVVPASTLLFPFVMYDYDADGAGQTTIISITNVSSHAQIVRVTLWSDYSIAILNFNIVLTGYDLQSFNIRDILRDGILPSQNTGANVWWDGTGTSKAGGSPFDDGPYSTYNALWGGALDAHFAASGLPDPESTQTLDCDPAKWESSPNHYTVNIPQATLDMFEAFLRSSENATTGYKGCDSTADVGFPGGTWFTNQEPRPTLMYLTADVVSTCNRDNPDGDPNHYFGTAGGVRIANVLMGDVVYLDPSTGFSEAENAVHLEAGNLAGISVADDDGNPTSFYARYHAGAGSAGVADNREPLPTAWAFRYIRSNNGQADTWVRTWKGSTNQALAQDLSDGSYGVGPSELYANSCTPYTYYAWDDDENVNSIGAGSGSYWSDGGASEPIPVPNLFPLETQEVPIDEFFIVGDDFGNAYGWMMFIWPRSNSADSSGVSGLESDQYQTWMSVKYKAFGRFTAAMQGQVIANYNCDAAQTLPGLGIGLHGGD
jgi:hypothetical protein